MLIYVENVNKKDRQFLLGMAMIPFAIYVVPPIDIRNRHTPTTPTRAFPHKPTELADMMPPLAAKVRPGTKTLPHN